MPSPCAAYPVPVLVPAAQVPTLAPLATRHRGSTHFKHPLTFAVMLAYLLLLALVVPALEQHGTAVVAAVKLFT